MQCFVKFHSQVGTERVKRWGEIWGLISYVEDRGEKGLGTGKTPAVAVKGKEGWSTRLLLYSREREGPVEDGSPELSCEQVSL